jgi:hypothetical protein
MSARRRLLFGGGGRASEGLAGRIRAEGRFLVNDAGTFRSRFHSGLYLCSLPPADRSAYIADTAAAGFNGFRTFCGHLGQVNQTPELARQVLPSILDEAASHGLYVYGCINTGDGYDTETHTREVGAILDAHVNGLGEGWNEIGHGSQSAIGKDPARALDVAKRTIPPGVTWTLGAPVGTDEPTPEGTYPTSGGEFNDAHLNRDRDLYNQVRRVREIENISATLKTFAMSGEPIGIAEVPMPGKQRFWDVTQPGDPQSGGFDDAGTRFSFIYGILCRGFEVGCVFHSELGLQARPMGANTARAARACLDGHALLPTTDRLAFWNASWVGSPVKSYTAAVRVYTFVTGDRGWSVAIGYDIGEPDVSLEIEWANGWHPVGVIAEQLGVQVTEIAR